MPPLHFSSQSSAAPARAGVSAHHGFEARIEAAQASAPKDRTAPRILIVEDGLIIAEELRRRCESLGYGIAAVVASGEEAVDMAQMTRPNLVLMDIRLGGAIDGIEAARRIGQTLDVPVVYTTSYSDEATVRRAKATCPFGYLLKPVGPQELRATVELALHHHTADCALRSTEGQFSALLESSFDAVLILDREGLISSANPQAVTLLGGASKEQILGRNITRFLSPATSHKFSQMLRKAADTNELEGLEVTFQPVTGRPFQSVVNLRTGNGHGGSATTILVVIRNPFAQTDTHPVSRSSRRDETRVGARE